MASDGVPHVLFVYYSFTQNTRRVADRMTDTLRQRGYEVTEAAIEFPDADYGKRFSKRPMSWPIAKIFGMLPAQLRRKTGDIRIPPEAASGEYDLVVIGSPTWWLTTCMPVRSYMQDPASGNVLDETPFARVLHLSSLLQKQLEDDPSTGDEERRPLHRRHAFRVRRQPSDVHVVVARVHASRRREAEVSGSSDTQAEPPCEFRRAGGDLHRSRG